MPRPSKKRFVKSFNETITKRTHLGKSVYRSIVQLAAFDIEIGQAAPHNIPGIEVVSAFELVVRKRYGFRHIPKATLNRGSTLLTVTSTQFTFVRHDPWVDMGVLLAIFYTKV